jgi:hypothetical protein
LPFQGQKRRFLKQFKEALSPIANKEDIVFVDLFGGSGLLSHAVKQNFPNAQVVWNDYDNYQERLDNVDNTNHLLSDIRILLSNSPEDKKVPEDVKKAILIRIKQEKGFVDYISLSGSLLFSGKYATTYEEFAKQTLYNRIRKSDYMVEGYLDGVQRVSVDYKVLYEQYKGCNNVIFLIDPPYLSTDCSSYNSDSYWKLGDYLDVLTTLQKSQYFYFTSNKSQVVELCEWMSTHSSFENPFRNCQYQTTAGSVNYASSYTDIMAYKYVSNESN